MDKLVRMKMHKLLLLAVACTWAMGAAAQWQWTDKDGRKVFSDRPPPPDIPEKSILKQPGGNRPARAATPAAPAASDAAPAVAAAPKAAASAAGAGKDKELEEKKAQAEAAEAAKKRPKTKRSPKPRLKTAPAHAQPKRRSTQASPSHKRTPKAKEFSWMAPPARQRPNASTGSSPATAYAEL